MKEWEILLLLEYKWRKFRLYRKMLNKFVKNGMKLSSHLLCRLNRSLDRQSSSLAKLKNQYEKMTGKMITFYKKDDI